jgi:predicted nuclease with TOPRIM domain
MWDWTIWGALIFAFAAGIAALVLLFRRAHAAYRDFGRTQRTVSREFDELAARSEATAARAEAAAGDTSELQASLERLRVSLAQLAVLTEALDDVDHMLARAVAFVPHK